MLQWWAPSLLRKRVPVLGGVFLCGGSWSWSVSQRLCLTSDSGSFHVLRWSFGHDCCVSVCVPGLSLLSSLRFCVIIPPLCPRPLPVLVSLCEVSLVSMLIGLFPSRVSVFLLFPVLLWQSLVLCASCLVLLPGLVSLIMFSFVPTCDLFPCVSSHSLLHSLQLCVRLFSISWSSYGVL